MVNTDRGYRTRELQVIHEAQGAIAQKDDDIGRLLAEAHGLRLQLDATPDLPSDALWLAQEDLPALLSWLEPEPQNSPQVPTQVGVPAEIRAMMAQAQPTMQTFDPDFGAGRRPVDPAVLAQAISQRESLQSFPNPSPLAAPMPPPAAAPLDMQALGQAIAAALATKAGPGYGAPTAPPTPMERVVGRFGRW